MAAASYGSPIMSAAGGGDGLVGDAAEPVVFMMRSIWEKRRCRSRKLPRAMPLTAATDLDAGEVVEVQGESEALPVAAEDESELRGHPVVSTQQPGWTRARKCPAGSFGDWMEWKPITGARMSRSADGGRPGHRDQGRSKRSRFMTLFHAATKSARNFSCASSLA
jgi:hypothetical protein